MVSEPTDKELLQKVFDIAEEGLRANIEKIDTDISVFERRGRRTHSEL